MKILNPIFDNSRNYGVGNEGFNNLMDNGGRSEDFNNSRSYAISYGGVKEGFTNSKVSNEDFKFNFNISTDNGGNKYGVGSYSNNSGFNEKNEDYSIRDNKMPKQSKTNSKKNKLEGKLSKPNANKSEEESDETFTQCFIKQNHLQRGVHRDHIKHCEDFKLCFKEGKSKAGEKDDTNKYEEKDDTGEDGEKDDTNEDDEETRSKKTEKELDELVQEGWMLMPVESYKFFCCLHCGVKMRQEKLRISLKKFNVQNQKKLHFHLQSKHHQYHVRHCLGDQKCKKKGKKKIGLKDWQFRKAHPPWNAVV